MQTTHASNDLDHLRLLAIFHYVVAGLVALMSMFPLIYLALGIALLSGAMDNPSQGEPPPAFVGWIFVGIASFFILAGLTMATLILIAGRRLNRQKNHLFCLIVAGVECIFMPFGTVLGAFTIIVLTRPSVKDLFGVSQESPRGR